MNLTSDDRKIVYDGIDLQSLVDLIIPFQIVKDMEYDSHWCKRGILGYIYGCMYRQADRLKPGFENLMDVCSNNNTSITNKQDAAALSILDTLLDVAVYALLGVCLIAAKFPNAGEQFIEKLQKRVESIKDKS